MPAIALLGHGTVGSGVAEILLEARGELARKTGLDIYVKYILDIRAFPGSPYADAFTKDFGAIVADADVAAVVEVMGGIHPAYEYARDALLAGKSVVTSNKELVAAKGAELLALAREKGRRFLFEASVGGCVPILRAVHSSLAGDEIDEICGILNGTTNYILTRMLSEGAPFAQALEEAQRLGYAERKPDADILGQDSCRKISILASLAFGRNVEWERVTTRGVVDVAPEDMRLAAGAGYAVKLLARTSRGSSPGRCFAEVGPCLVPHGQTLLAGVDSAFNGVVVRSKQAGEQFFYGQGAGKLPTASAVVSDIVDCLTGGGNNPAVFWSGEASLVDDYRNVPALHYIRLRGAEAAEAAGALFGALRPLRDGDCTDHAAIIPAIAPAALEQRLAALRKRGVETVQIMRVYESCPRA